MLLVLFPIAWLNGFFLGRWFEVYRRPAVRRGYWFATLAAWLVLTFVWAVRTVPGVFDYDAFRAMAYAAFTWIISQAALLVLLPLIFLARRAARVRPAADTAGGDGGPALSRRAFLRQAAAFAPLAAFGVSAQGVFAAETDMAITRHDIPVAGLPPEFEGLRVAQLSDAHLGAYFPLRRLEKVIGLLEAEQADLLAITGDLADDLSLLDAGVELLDAYAARLPYGAYFCWGNHEYYRDIGKFRRALGSSGIKLLENSGEAIGKGARQLYIAGVDFPWTRDGVAQSVKRAAFLAEAMRAAPPEAVTLLLSHHPNFLAEAFHSGIDLTLSGHSHGGQIGLFGRPLLPLSYPYCRGLYRSGASFGYVNCGAGHWFPFRLGCPPEISVFRLTRA